MIILMLIMLVFLVLIIMPNFNKNNKNKNQETPCCALTPKNQQQCFESKYRPCCPLNGTYKQCTNNFKHKIECQCDQNTLNLDICRKPTNEKCFHKNDLDNKPFEKPNDCCSRVNMYNPEITIFDTLK